MEIHVITCFLKDDDKILILKRSSKVGSYPNKWAGISGYIEGDENPYHRALKEIREEVGLNEDDLELLVEGSVIRVRDGPWVVHPFLFRVKDAEIKLDWEHVDYRWIDPLEIVEYDTVPRLAEALKSVLKDDSSCQ
jgi:8-oxo-dGTP pyrophosphatase MutT (NUDIX family)